MPRTRITPVGAISRGLLAGFAGTAAMTASQLVAMKLQGSESSTVPGQVAQRVARGVFQRDVPDSELGRLTQLVHWGYGTAWGAVYGVLQATHPLPIPLTGTVFTLMTWSAGSAVGLPAMGMAPPVTQRPAAGNAIELGYHVVYGFGVAWAYRALSHGCTGNQSC